MVFVGGIIGGVDPNVFIDIVYSTSILSFRERMREVRVINYIRI